MRRIWAVAVNTIRQALRIRVAAGFIVLLLILLPVMGITATGDGTLKGRLQTFVSYGLSLTSLLLCLLTIIISTYALTSDIKQKQIFTVITKPIRRFQLVLGKLLGVIVLDAVLLIIFSSIIYAITIYMPRYYGAKQPELVQLDNEFFTARTGVAPPIADVSKEVRETYSKLDAGDQLPEDATRDQVIAWLTSQKKLESRAAAPGHELIWEFRSIKPLDPDKSLFIRFKYDVSMIPRDEQVYSQWFIGDYRQIQYGTPMKTRIYSLSSKDPIRTFREFKVPANAVADDGYLAVGFLNVPLNQTVIIFPLEDGLEILYKADTFTANYLRAVLLIFFRLVFLACVGTLGASFLSFPVAILFCLVVFFTASFSGFVIDSFDYLGGNLSGVYSYTIKPAIRLLPQFDEINPTKFMVPARLIKWSLLARAGALIVCVKAFLLLLLGLLIFSYREIARVIV